MSDYDPGADHDRRLELMPIVGALLLHMHNHDGAAVRTLLEQEGYFDSPDRARQFVMAMGETMLGMLTMLVADEGEVGKLLRTFTDVAHGA